MEQMWRSSHDRVLDGWDDLVSSAADETTVLYEAERELSIGEEWRMAYRDIWPFSQAPVGFVLRDTSVDEWPQVDEWTLVLSSHGQPVLRPNVGTGPEARIEGMTAAAHRRAELRSLPGMPLSFSDRAGRRLRPSLTRLDDTVAAGWLAEIGFMIDETLWELVPENEHERYRGPHDHNPVG